MAPRVAREVLHKKIAAACPILNRRSVVYLQPCALASVVVRTVCTARPFQVAGRLLSIAGNHMETTEAALSRLCRVGFAGRVLAAGSAHAYHRRSGNNTGALIET